MIHLTDEEFKLIFPFSSPRSNQKEIIEKIISAFIEDKKKYVIFCGPTGTGKSVIGYTVAKFFELLYPKINEDFMYQKTFVLTSQKCLQEQYHKELDIPYILGKINYTCQKNSNLTCEMGDCKGIKSKICKDCPYILQRDFVFNSEVGNMNYSYYLALNVFASIFDEETGKIKSTGAPRRSLLVCDECHNVSSELSKLGEIKLTNNILVYLGITDLTLPMDIDTEHNKITWLTYTLKNKLLSQQIYLETQIKNYKEMKISREYKMNMQKYSLVSRYIKIIEEIDKQFKQNHKIIIHSTNEEISYKLLFSKTFFYTYMNLGAEFILFMSATVLNKNEFCDELGINPNDAIYISTDSIFPVENRLIHFTPVGSLSYKEKNKTMPKLIKSIKDILKKYPDKKGIIHTVNYNFASTIIDKLANTKLGDRLLMPQGKNRQETIETFMESNYPYVLISPSLTEGLDLKDDLSRFCIICKMPYMSLGDEWVKARLKINQNWYVNKACETLVQMTGRSIRTETDYCDTYILDEDFLKLAKAGDKIFPDWWKKSVIEK